MIFKDLEDISFYASNVDSDKIYAEYTVSRNEDKASAVRKFVEVDSPDFESYLRLVVVPKHPDKSVTASDIIQKIHDYARVFGGFKEVAVKVRTSGRLKDGYVEYALYNQEGEYVAITKDDYNVVSESKAKFIKKSTNAAQIRPQKTEKNLFELLAPYVSATRKMFILFAVWLVQAFCEGNHSALLITAEAGSGKSTLTKIIREILDPSNLGVNRLIAKADNLITTLTNAYLVAFDNMRDISQDDSDTLCVAVTGGTYTKREAYSSNKLAVYDLHNTVILNSISFMVQESDFAQRCLCLKLKRLQGEDRRCDSEIYDNFKQDLPYILHCIYATIGKAMQIIEHIKPKRVPRMMEPYVEMLAIAVALGVEEERFEEIYFENLDLINKMRANNDFIYAVREYMTTHVNGRSLEGTASEVFMAVRNNFSGNKAILPGSASQFSRKLKTEYAALLSIGYTVNVDDTHADGTYIKIIKKK